MKSRFLYYKYIFIFTNLLIISSCGGGGGGSITPTEPTPTSSLSSSSSSVLIDTVVTLTWSSTNATSCSASGTWSGTKATSGSEDVTIVTPGNNPFTITCSGTGGSQAASVTVEGYRNTEGVTVDGYIRQADIFIDTNDSYIADSGEDTTTSDNDGKFTIKYSDGNLISLGGTDLDSGNALDNLLIVHKLAGHSNFKAVTPVTSVAAFMADASLVNAALGIDASLDIATVDPVAGKGDGGINDYLYEKGNQLTVLAYALQNITNNLNTTTETTQDYFKAIAEELDTEYAATATRVNIETEAFITKVIDNIISAKALTVAEEARTNLISALSSVMPVIEVKSSDTLSTAVFDFATSTLQTDAQALANGTATAEIISSYQSDVLNYIATDRGVDADELAPEITAIADEATLDEDESLDINPLSNDSYLTSAPISVAAANGVSGVTSVSNNIVTYSPDADFNGSDAFDYTIIQGDKTSSANVTVTINAVNDAPTFDNLLSTYSVAENQTGITTVVGDDVDGDSLTIDLSGTDAASFTLSTSNVLAFLEAPDFETKNSYAITLSVSDESETTPKDITILVTNVNDEAPVITSDPTFSAAENQTAIGSVAATDTEGDTLTYKVSGTELAISSTGVLTFIAAPDYETKSSYTVTILVTDGVNPTSQDITVNVTNLNDNSPVITSDATFTAAENQTAIGTVIAADADGDDLTFTVLGTELEITSAGVITFAAAPDYETKSSYTATVTVTDGLYETSQLITINITDVADTFAFTGKTIDGYIDGANVFVDQNFNFRLEPGELSTTTNSDGTFELVTNNESLFNCLSSRPIIANVPVGAIDSTLGNVTQAYQMVLPSISDTGNSSIVISPFTSLFAEAILSSKSDISQDLTVAEGCESGGDAIASKISTRIAELKASIESNFGITYEQLISDFIENPSENVDESSAQNIAKLLPYLQTIDNQVSDYLTDTFEKDIRANVSLSEASLSIIFGDSSYSKLPLDFYSNYETRPNSEDWFRSETLDASGAFISRDGVLSREDCSENDTTLCNISELSLDNVANASTSYRRTSSFSKSTPVDFDELGITNGSLSVSASLSSSWRNNSDNWDQPNNRSRECQKQESINFTSGDQVDPNSFWTQFSYNTYSQGFEKADCNDTRHYYTPILNASTYTNNGSGVSLGAQYYIFDVLRSGISSNLPYDFVENSVTINPELVVKDIAVLPRMFKDLNTIRSLFRGDDYILFNYDDSDGQHAIFEAGTNPSNDMFENRRLGAARIYGQPARTAFYDLLKVNPNLNIDFYGDSVPINTSILGRIANSYIEIMDYSGSSEIIHQVTPTYDYTNQTLDYSLVSALDLENIKDFIQSGINGNPLNAKIWFNPDSSINSTVPIKLFLYEGEDANLDANESFFEMSFDLTVSSSASGNSNSYESSQLWTIEAGAKILVSYTEDGITLSQTVVNIDEDKITLTDSNTGDTSDNLDSYINQPSNLNLKLLNLISKVSNKIAGIQNFFIDGGTYTIKLDLGSGGHSLIGFNRNIVKNITGTFNTKSSPDYAINVNDIIIKEGDSKNICFDRSSNGDLSATEFDLSFTQRERPGKGGFADDFTLSKTNIVFAENDTQSCTSLTAIKDSHFDWAHDIYIDISEPSNGQPLVRSRMKITILDIYFPNRIDWRRR